jgi:hypothetical protein
MGEASFVSFNHTGLSEQINRLQSDSSKQVTHQAMKDLFEGIEDLQDVEFLQQPRPVTLSANSFVKLLFVLLQVQGPFQSNPRRVFHRICP